MIRKFYEADVLGRSSGGDNNPITGEDVAALLHHIHEHYPGEDGKGLGGKIIYFEEDILPVLKALGLPSPIWGKSISIKNWEKLRR